MTRDEAMQLMSCRLYWLLSMMAVRWRNWRPKIGYPSCSAGFNTGGSVSDFDDLEHEGNAAAIAALETGWADLNPAERTVIEMIVGLQPWVWVPRESILLSAIDKLERKVRI